MTEKLFCYLDLLSSSPILIGPTQTLERGISGLGEIVERRIGRPDGGAGSHARLSRESKKFRKPHEHSVITEANGKEDGDHDEIVAQMRRSKQRRSFGG